MADKVLDVRNLRISFRTANGKVQAVRGIDFDLERGETLAVVGESGSGKSVTARSLLGILAPNAIVESGELIYDGMDLLKLTEEDFHDIRGEKIAMIFQDPLSSLNPIVKVGKQLTEAMIIKGKAKQRKSRKEFNDKLGKVGQYMNASIEGITPELAKENLDKCKSFDRFEYKHCELEQAYNRAKESAIEAVEEIDDILFEIDKKVVVPKQVPTRVRRITVLAAKAVERYVVHDKAETLNLSCGQVSTAAAEVRNGGEQADYTQLVARLQEIREILNEAIGFEMPNFFALGYYLTYSTEPVPEMSVADMNAFMRKYLDEHFMLDFIARTRRALLCSHQRSYAAQQALIPELEQCKEYFGAETLDHADVKRRVKEMIAKVEAAIDPLVIHKNSNAYTFGSSMRSAVDFYFRALKRNEKETARFNKQTAKREAKIAQGKQVDFEVVPADVVDRETLIGNIRLILDRLIDDYRAAVPADAIDFDGRTVAMIDHFKEMASGVVHRVTRRMAKSKALKLMEEVGIPQPRVRYKQYPFQFSGGMRQRIVIAIALSADPDILVCDEPTTALDVTIQSQILELINKLKEERHISVIFITHDLGVVANMADRIAVMYAGKIVEMGTSKDVFYDPRHPYTWALLSSMPDLDTTEKLEAIPGTPPNMIYPPKGDAFAERNKYAMKIDFERQPPMFKVTDTHYAATWLLHPDAPKVEPPKIVTERIERMKRMVAEETAAALDVPDAQETPAAKKATKKPAPQKATTEKNATKTKKPTADKKPTTKKTAVPKNKKEEG